RGTRSHQQVLDEIGIEISDKLINAPSTSKGAIGEPAKKVSSSKKIGKLRPC
ncbi:Charged multivesicular body protein 2b, partial [Caligus rogercresseyi]